MKFKDSQIEECRQLRSIRYVGLFGSSDHRIDLEESEPTILTGANGAGKSTLLRLVQAVASGDLGKLAAAPVDEFELSFNVGPDFYMVKTPEKVTLSWGEYTSEIPIGKSDLHLPEWAEAALRELDNDIPMFLQNMSEIARARNISFREVMPIRNRLRREEDLFANSDDAEWLELFRATFPVLFITDQRLISQREAAGTAENGLESRRAVIQASNSIAKLIKDSDTDYARSAQVADRKLAASLVSRLGPKSRDVTAHEIASLSEKVDQRRSILRNIGLLDESDAIDVGVADQELATEPLRKVIQVILESTLQKLEALDELEGRLTAFKEFLDRKLFPKRLELDRKAGMRFALNDESTLRPEQLSSGEQQIVVLAYDILFKASASTLVIIDEPEISLHVSWQDSLVEDLGRMGRVSSVQFLIATHSPMILAGNPFLERPLPGRK